VAGGLLELFGVAKLLAVDRKGCRFVSVRGVVRFDFEVEESAALDKGPVRRGVDSGDKAIEDMVRVVAAADVWLTKDLSGV